VLCVDKNPSSQFHNVAFYPIAGGELAGCLQQATSWADLFAIGEISMLLSFKGKLFPFAGGTGRRRRERPKPSGLLVTENLESRTLLTAIAVDEAVVTVDEGATATQTGTYSDAVTLAASVGTVTQDSANGTWSWSLDVADGPDDGQLVTITATGGQTAQAQFTLVVNNVAPTVGVGDATVSITEGETATNSGTFFDPAFLAVADDPPPPPPGGGGGGDPPPPDDGGGGTGGGGGDDNGGGTGDGGGGGGDGGGDPPPPPPPPPPGGGGGGDPPPPDDGGGGTGGGGGPGSGGGNGDGGTGGGGVGGGDPPPPPPPPPGGGGDPPPPGGGDAPPPPPAARAASPQAMAVAPQMQAAIPQSMAAPATVYYDDVQLSASLGTVVRNDNGTWSWSWNSSVGTAGTHTVTITADDEDGGVTVATFDVVVMPLNTPPVANNDLVGTDEDNSVTFSVLTNDTDDQGNIAAASTVALNSPSKGVVTDNGSGSFSFDPNGEFESLAVNESADVSFDYRIEDAFGETDDATVTITVNGVNDAPVISNGGNVSIDEGQTATSSGSWSDVDASDVVTLSASTGDVSRNADGTWNWSFNSADGPDESQTVVITADDGNGGVTTSSFELTVNNVAPTVASVSSTNADVENASGDGSVSVSGSFSDPGLDTHTVTVNWGDGTSEDVSVDQTADSFTGDHDYSSGGIFTVTVTVTDSDGAISTTETTSAVVEGAGLVDGTLFVIGTDGKDVIHVHEHWRRDRITVHAHLDIRHHGWWWHRHSTSTHVYQTFAAEDVDQIVVHALGGNDHVHVGGWFYGTAKDAVIFGGDGNDHLIGSRGNDVIVGGAGNDHIYGGRGRDILIGGEGRDKVDGGSNDDLVIGGSAANETDRASLDAALSAWADGDLSAALLSLGTISDESTRDYLRGGRGTDELIGGTRDKLKR
jgi:hypothetical protein